MPTGKPRTISDVQKFLSTNPSLTEIKVFFKKTNPAEKPKDEFFILSTVQNVLVNKIRAVTSLQDKLRDFYQTLQDEKQALVENARQETEARKSPHEEERRRYRYTDPDALPPLENIQNYSWRVPRCDYQGMIESEREQINKVVYHR